MNPINCQKGKNNKKGDKKRTLAKINVGLIWEAHFLGDNIGNTITFTRLKISSTKFSSKQRNSFENMFSNVKIPKRNQ